MITGKTTGQTAGRLFDPQRVIKEEEEAAAKKAREEEAKMASKKAPAASKELSKKEKAELVKKESKKSIDESDRRSPHSVNSARSPTVDFLGVEPPNNDVDMNSFTLVCYGLPNLMVGKA